MMGLLFEPCFELSVPDAEISKKSHDLLTGSVLPSAKRRGRKSANFLDQFSSLFMNE